LNKKVQNLGNEGPRYDGYQLLRFHPFSPFYLLLGK